MEEEQSKVYLTDAALEELKKQLNQLKNEGRKDVAEKIKIARSFGDLSENAEYDAALNEQSLNDSQINEIRQKIKNAVLITEDTSTKNISVGSTVEIKDYTHNEVVTYKIVGATEADFEENKISNESPVGKALIGKKKGDKVKVDVPKGSIELEVLNIKKS